MTKVKKVKHNLVILKKVELYVLKLSAHNFNKEQIREFLDIDSEELFKIIKRIKKELQVSNWYQAIVKGFELGLLKKLDYIDNIVKREALSYCKEIFTTLNEDSYSKEGCIKAIVLLYLNSCVYSMEGENKKKYSTIEKKYLELKFKGVTSKFINKELRLISSNHIKKNVFYKLNTNDWFNCFKKAFQLKIINKEEYLTINLDIEATKVESNLFFINANMHNTNKEKQSLIYDELLKFYSIIEFNYLLKPIIFNNLKNGVRKMKKLK